MTDQRQLEQQALEAVAEGFKFNAMKLPSLPEVTAQVTEVSTDPVTVGIILVRMPRRTVPVFVPSPL